LARAAGLLLVGVVDIRDSGDGLAIGDLWRADIGLDLELALHAVDDHLKMVLTGPLNDGLAALVVDGDAEGRILGRKTRERLAHLSWSPLALGSMAISIKSTRLFDIGSVIARQRRRRDGYDPQPERLKEDIEDIS
jgi:hypothetical protein